MRFLRVCRLTEGGTRARLAGTLPLPATIEGVPDPSPPFDIFATTKFNYPYTLHENLTGERKEIAWRALFFVTNSTKSKIRNTALGQVGGHPAGSVKLGQGALRDDAVIAGEHPEILDSWGSVSRTKPMGPRP
ncbi:MAG TPA: hypothetical protein VGZ73_24785 [Bryobacteraceae bacterium]|nr:hypothetical protein [Bryobacteraceae bacterium]